MQNTLTAYTVSLNRYNFYLVRYSSDELKNSIKTESYFLKKSKLKFNNKH